MNALEALKKIRDGGPVRDYVGICGNVEDLIEETMPYELKELMDTKQIQRPERCGIIPAVMNFSTG